MKNYINEHELKRRELWIKAWCSVAGTINCYTKDAATAWADKALQDFDQRFAKLDNEKEDV